jgi:hypothetical protein
MLKNLPIKKEYGLIAGSLVLLLLCYQLAFRPTVEAWHLHRSLSNQLANSGDLSFQPGYMERKSKNLDDIIGRYKADTTALRSNILTTIAIEAEKLDVRLSSVPMQESSYRTKDYVIQQLNFEGDFFSLTKLLHQLQSMEGIGTLRSLTIFKKKDAWNNNDSKMLQMKVFVVVHIYSVP